MAFYDGLLKLAGRETQTDRNRAAETELETIRQAKDPASRLAALASVMQGMSDDGIHRALPRIADEKIPPHGRNGADSPQRELFVAKAIRQVATNFLDNGNNGKLADPLGRAAREFTMGKITQDEIEYELQFNRLEGLLERRRVPIAFATHVFLAAGKAHEDVLDRLGRHVERDPKRLSALIDNTETVIPQLPIVQRPDGYRGHDYGSWGRTSEWTRNALSYEVAKARGGLIPADQIVQLANHDDWPTTFLVWAGKSEQGRDLIAVHPNFEKGRKARPDDVATIIKEHLSSHDKPITEHIEMQKARHAPVRTKITPEVSVAKSHPAAIEAMREGLSNQR